jgi:peptide-methionine (S)-S-oxide reductase
MSMRGPLVALFLLAAGAAAAAAPPAAAPARATFAAGCFWCVESDFDKVPGVLATVSGYMGGQTKNPTYEQVSAGGTGHAEVVQVEYDPKKVTYAQLLQVFWRNVDPLTPNAQFCDHGPQYRSALFVADAEQRRLAEESLRALQASKRFDKPIVTEILPAAEFYPAEEYHQDYYRKNPVRYRYYRYSCGRDARLKELWGDK